MPNVPFPEITDLPSSTTVSLTPAPTSTIPSFALLLKYDESIFTTNRLETETLTLSPSFPLLLETVLDIVMKVVSATPLLFRVMPLLLLVAATWSMTPVVLGDTLDPP
jgi:hypothetical protein